MSDIYSNLDPVISEKYSDIISMLKKSQSINEEEKEYWVTSLDVMSDDQIQSLRDILEQEIKDRQNLVKDSVSESEQEMVEKMNAEKLAEIQKRKKQRVQDEIVSEQDETSQEENLLKLLEEA